MKRRILQMVCAAGLVSLAQAQTNDGGEPAGTKQSTVSEWVRKGDDLMQRSRNTLGHDFTAAGEAYSKALALDDKNAEALVGMAWVRNSEHDFEAGADWARRALKVDPGCLQAHALLGDGAMELGEYDAAFDHFQKALDLRADLSTLSRSAHLLWLTGDTTRAMALMEQAIRAGGPVPENEAWCRAELALMQFKAGAMKASEQQAQAALALAPGNPRVLTMMGRVRAAQGKIDEAIEYFERSVADHPIHEPMVELVDLYSLQGAVSDAEAWKARVLGMHGSHHSDGSHSHHGGDAQLALFMAEQGMDAEEALHEADHAYKAFPNINAADALAWCAYKAGDNDLARRMIRRALIWGTAEPQFHYHAGMIYAASGQPAAAAKSLATALNLNPAFDPVDAERARAELKKLRAKGS